MVAQKTAFDIHHQNYMSQSEPAGHKQMTSVQQARRLGPLPVARTPRDLPGAPVSGAIDRGDHIPPWLTNQPVAC